MSTGKVDLHGWVYDIEHGSVNAYDQDQDKFVSVEERYATLIAASAAKEAKEGKGA